MNESERRTLVLYRISKATDTLKEVDVHIDHQLWNTAVNRIYFIDYEKEDVIGLISPAKQLIEVIKKLLNVD